MPNWLLLIISLQEGCGTVCGVVCSRMVDHVACLLEYKLMYAYENRIATFRNWPFTENCCCTPENVSMGMDEKAMRLIWDLFPAESFFCKWTKLLFHEIYSSAVGLFIRNI